MPYSIKEKGNKFLLINSETGRVLGTHDTREAAMRQMRAIGANK